MDCVKAQEYLHPYIDGALPAAALRELEQHLSGCPACAAKLQRLRALSLAIRALPPAQLPPGFNQALHEKLAAEPKPPQPALMQRGWARAVAAAALLVVVIGAINMLGNNKAYRYDGIIADAPTLMLERGTGAPAPSSPASSYPEEYGYYDQELGVASDDSAYSWDMPEEEANEIYGEISPGMSALYSPDDARELYEEELIVEPEADSSAQISSAAGANVGAQTRLERKIIRDATLSLKVEDFSAAYQMLNDLAERYGGYVVSGDSYSYDGEKMQRGHITMRVEANRLNQALAEIESLGKVESSNTFSQDITMEYYDIAGRLSQYQKQEQRLLAILAQAETVEDIIAVERELTRTRSQLESLNGQIRYYDQMTALSSITVDLYQPDQNTQTVRLGGWAGLWQDISAGFISGLNGLISGASSLAVGLARLLPLLVVLALILLVVVLLIKRRRL